MNEWAEQRWTRFGGVHRIRDWRLRVYITSNSEEVAWSTDAQAKSLQITDRCLGYVSFDPDYTLFRAGVVCVHFGRRGVMVMLAHFGLWGDMLEIFMRSWYREEGADIENLTRDDPMLCFHDIPIFLADIALARGHVASAVQEGVVQWDNVMERYVTAAPVSHG